MNIKLKRILIFTSIVIMVFLAGCDTNIIDYAKSLERDTISETENLKKDIKEGDELNININVGDINITRGDGDDVEIFINKRVKASSKATAEEIMENIEIVINNTSRGLDIRAKAKNNDGMDLWKWKNKYYKLAEIIIDIEIEVPSIELDYSLENNVGTIFIENLQGTIRAISNVGNVNINSLILIGKNTFETNVGKITVLDIDIEKTESILAYSNVGSVIFDLSNANFENTVCDFINIAVDVGNVDVLLSEGLKYETKKNANKLVAKDIELLIQNTEIIITTSVGSVDINN